MSTNRYDLLIIGGGVSGSALLYLAARYTDIRHIGLLEKYAAPARVNSLSSNNSQTLHCGDIETNYTLEKALKVKRAASMLRNYATAQPDSHHIIFKYSKMVLGVGTKECEKLRQRFAVFGEHYPNLRLLDKKAIAKIEPHVAMIDDKFRSDEVVALGSTNEYTAVNFEALACSFVRQAQMTREKHVDVHYNEYVSHIKIEGNRFLVETGGTCYQTRALVVCAGGHSLKLAHDLGYGLHYSCLPVAGSYYFTPQLLNGKVYTVQNDALPFAAIHGDPDVLVPGATRFGPTALILPILERYNLKTLPDFLQVFRFDRRVAKVLWDLIRVKDIRNYMLKNFLFEIPVIRRILFLRDARKIVPSLRLGDLKFANRVGGIRPQLIDKDHRKLLLGEAKIDTGIGAIFNMTPSPGGTSCLENAELDLRVIVKFLDATINEEAFKNDLLGDDEKHTDKDFSGRVLSGNDAA
ncbi:MAG: FAD-dependent oxidoreductase [Gammaproteobacteria bacterium]|nr:FAD-dependent oxidoreductase [Gammaproteobacteria bacterium]MCW8909790.1 FAD-dependent oxidoreductase [Gammaproteobacteria bacterium]MCW9005205.1 FAD-dependent oxidoreductase [Gammaproteobacteria bacterium]MCW9054999.1 FAD-dependent oxidoreductase [Gammaproteobacteria bacterium]